MINCRCGVLSESKSGKPLTVKWPSVGIPINVLGGTGITNSFAAKTSSSSMLTIAGAGGGGHAIGGAK
jgi:hypothetical protein